MTRYAAFTSMNRDYYDHCGRSMLRSYKKCLAHLMPMYVYNEDNFEVKVKTVTELGWHESPEYLAFQERHLNSHVKKFAKKGFSVIHAMKNLDCERLIWFDADTIIQQEIPRHLLDLITPKDVLSTHFSVWHTKQEKDWHSCETGFFIINKTHPAFDQFYETYRDIYVNDKTDNIRRFYDGEVYGRTVELMQQKGHNMMNLNPGRHKTPISRSVLAPYLNHFKAGVKDSIDNNALAAKFDLNEDD
jgi:hypothetical protein